MKIKENEKINKYLHFAEELKQLQNMKVTVILMIDSDLGTIPKVLEKRQELNVLHIDY